ncbi:hypothetical protein EU528_06635 [Candidatus Thorarchaeota archaeon]|nr:MAG: hypothetical protein EU528_06635 [Candidatus Thorarchaeota archaeon]
MDILFKCPECKGNALIQMTDEEADEVKQRIQTEGRSPTLIIRCENNHELLVTLYNPRTGEGLGVRDIVVPLRSDKDNSVPKKEKESSEIDWLTKAFGGKS